MDWDKLRIFHSVAEAGSLTHAGKSLNLSQSAVSKQISALEQNLGTALFRRHARGLILTEQGEILHEATKGIFKKLSAIKGQLKDTQELAEGPLTITISEFIGTTWLAPRLADFRRHHPDIQLTVLFDDRILDLNLREADAAIRLSKPVEPYLIQRHMTSIAFHVIGSRAYFDKAGRPKKVSDLKKHALIGFPDNIPAPVQQLNWLLDVAKTKARDKLNVMLLNSMYSIYRAVSDGAGIAALPDYVLQQNKDLEIVLPKITRAPADMYFTYPEERRNSKRINIFRDFLLDHIEKTSFS